MLNTGRATLILLAAVTFPAAAQTFDNTGNNKLNGAYYFREVVYDLDSGLNAVAYGNISFNGIGSYTISGSEGDTNSGAISSYNYSGNYSISASGFGFIFDSIVNSNIYGSVSNGIFIGSATESGYNELFIAAPVSGQSAGTLNGSYSIAYMDNGLYDGFPFDALLTMNANGGGGIGTVSVSAYQSSSTPSTQNISPVTYSVSNSAFVLNFPNNQNNFIFGQEYLYSSPDGNFVFGGAPDFFDFFVGVRNGSSGSNFGGLYYTAGMDEDVSQLASEEVGLDSYYGAFNALTGQSCCTVIGHERVFEADSSAFGYTFDDVYQGSNGSYSDQFTAANYIGGNGGALRIGYGLGPSLSISVAIAAPSFTPSGVYIYPTGVENAATFTPFTAGISPGEFITIVGTNLGPSNTPPPTTLPLPPRLGGVQVLINNLPAAIDYVSPNQINAIVPYEITGTYAQIQVINNGTPSNVISELINMTTPGIFTNNPQGGTGIAATLHPDFSLVNEQSPAQIGETISVFLSGLGTTFPSVSDGAGGVSSMTSNTITADISGTTATVVYSGLAPGLAGLYQVNVTIPSGVTPGDNYLDLGGPDSYTSEAIIPIGSGGLALARPSRANTLRSRHASAHHLQKNGSYRLRMPE